MATTKVYGIYGRTTAVIRVPVGKGKAFMQIEFSRGVPNAGPNYRPATFATSDPVTQSILEKSSMFGSLYTIYRTVVDTPTAPANAKKPAKAAAPEPMEGITTKEEAVEFLKGKGAKASNLKDADSILKFAEKIGVSFPNLTL